MNQWKAIDLDKAIFGYFSKFKLVNSLFRVSMLRKTYNQRWKLAGAKGPMTPIFLDWPPTFWSQKAPKFGFPARYNQNFARAFGARTYYLLKF